MQRIKEIIAWCNINRRDSISVWYLFPPGPNWFWGAIYNSRVFKLEKEDGKYPYKKNTPGGV